MQTRVSRHSYEDEENISSLRSKKNEKLYSQDYTEDKINVPKISNGRELNEEEFQKIINQSQTRSMKKITQEDIAAFEKKQLEEETPVEKVYDINSVLETAKNSRKEVDEEKYKVPKFEDLAVEQNDNGELLSDLMGGDDTIPAQTSTNDTVIENADVTSTVTGTKIDNSFYSKSIKFKRRDFLNNDYDDDDDELKSDEKHSTSQIILTVVIVVLLVIAIVLGILVLSKIKF